MKLPSISNGQAQVLMGLTAIGVVFFIYYKGKETIKEAAKDVKVALDPTDAKNLASRGARAALGEDFVIDKIGGSVAGVVDFFSGKPVEAAKTTKSHTTTQTKKQVDRFWSGLKL